MDTIMLKAADGGDDFISKLPDDILVCILSLLETKEAVSTCILSSRWTKLWTLTYNLYFDDFGINNFVNAVDKVLSNCQSQEIWNFHLECSNLEESDLSRVTPWICFAVDHGVCDLTIIVDIDAAWHERCIRLPQNILTCNTLVEFQLDSDFIVDVPDSMCFPSLKTLYLTIVFPDVDMMNKLFRSCPVLEDLNISASELDKLDYSLNFDIYVPTLKRLIIWHVVDYYYFDGDFEHKYVITACNLEYLRIHDGTLASFVVNGRPLLDEVELDVGSSYVEFDEDSEFDEFQVLTDEASRVIELLRGINLTKDLALTSTTTDSLNMAIFQHIPAFPNLTHLELDIEARFGFELIPHFLQRSPNLEILILVLEPHNNLDNYFNFESENISSCLRSRVEKIKIRNMLGEENEQEVVRYLLGNGGVLKEFYAHIVNSESKQELQRKILMYPRGSAACEIKFL